MPLTLYDTWSRTVRPFTPIHAGFIFTPDGWRISAMV